MQEAEKYRKFATECHRLAASASEEDKTVLLKIADAWDAQARLVEAASLKKGSTLSNNADGSDL